MMKVFIHHQTSTATGSLRMDRQFHSPLHKGYNYSSTLDLINPCWQKGSQCIIHCWLMEEYAPQCKWNSGILPPLSFTYHICAYTYMYMLYIFLLPSMPSTQQHWCARVEFLYGVLGPFSTLVCCIINIANSTVEKGLPWCLFAPLGNSEIF